MIKRYSEFNIASLAKSRGYNIGPVYHGTNTYFNIFSMNYFGKTDDGYYGKGFYFTPDKSEAQDYGKNILNVYLNLHNPLFLPDAGGGNHISLIKAREILANLYEKPEWIPKKILPEGYYVKKVPVTEYGYEIPGKYGYRVYPEKSLYGTDKERYGAVRKSPLQAIVSFNDKINKTDFLDVGWLLSLLKEFGRKSLIDKLYENGYDGLEIEDAESSAGKIVEFIVKNPSQIKSADPVTYDDTGKPIPLSKRFNPNNPDIRY